MAASGERDMDMSHQDPREGEQEMRMSLPETGRASTGHPGRAPGPRRRMEIMARTVETDVIPRLIIARRQALRGRVTGASSNVCNESDVVELAQMVLDPDETVASRHVEELSQRGLPMEAIYCELFADTARLLGAMWVEDEIAFTHVTTGVWRLQQMLHHFRSIFLAESPHGPAGRNTGLRILLAPAIGSQHSLGMAMVGEFFRRDGWSVHTALITSNTDLADILRSEWFDALGLSLAVVDRLDDLRATIAAGRRASRNLQIGVIVGGPAFVQNPAHASYVGADAVALDGRDAPRLIEQALNLSARPG